MKQPKGVLITKLTAFFGILELYLYIVFSSNNPMDFSGGLIWGVGCLTIWNNITKFVAWNFKPESYVDDELTAELDEVLQLN